MKILIPKIDLGEIFLILMCSEVAAQSGGLIFPYDPAGVAAIPPERPSLQSPRQASATIAGRIIKARD